MQRYSRNISAITATENEILQKSKVCVAGCGGLGGYAIEMLARLGIGSITVIDGDVFDPTNLNRQILATESNIGKSKAAMAGARIAEINSQIECQPINRFLDSENAEELIRGNQVVIDALDSISSRFILQDACVKASIPLVHGAIAGWTGQISTIFPNDNTMQKIYRDKELKGSEEYLGIPAFAPALISSIQVSEAIKILINKAELLRNKILFINLLEHEYQLIEL